MYLIGDAAILDRGFEGLTGCSVYQADVELGAGFRIGDEPHFGFGFAVEVRGNISGRVDLDGEVVGGIEDLDEDGETGGVREIVAENFLAMVLPKFIEGFTCEIT